MRCFVLSLTYIIHRKVAFIRSSVNLYHPITHHDVPKETRLITKYHTVPLPNTPSAMKLNPGKSSSAVMRMEMASFHWNSSKDSLCVKSTANSVSAYLNWSWRLVSCFGCCFEAITQLKTSDVEVLIWHCNLWPAASWSVSRGTSCLVMFP